MNISARHEIANCPNKNMSDAAWDFPRWPFALLLAQLATPICAIRRWFVGVLLAELAVRRETIRISFLSYSYAIIRSVEVLVEIYWCASEAFALPPAYPLRYQEAEDHAITTICYCAFLYLHIRREGTRPRFICKITAFWYAARSAFHDRSKVLPRREREIRRK